MVGTSEEAQGRPGEPGRLVVAVALVDSVRRVLAARRRSPPELAGLWEFPGGKVEPGEDELAALRRECREELRVEIETGRLFGEIALPRPGWRMRLWLGRVSGGTPVAVEHGALRWLGVDELDDVPWIPADAPLVDALRVELADPVDPVDPVDGSWAR
ncbi:NUDIX hydrolase [Parafrankia colletiae]|uniref:8-oxo-dGTP diphosphatase n=1 Tax=Parafrankia colletiae TaxID=573497 RepID=A0A1S1QBU4_9ACTN|nr:(deoxy)nucleoside triphosphate pyrophosphohydrolase [Parafrankia colletiae]MCK9903828.1 (deoxy)nucleoside triphosphate pyrophosphohydrolase [Frankia sp. Cpl3]OHV30562.1 NUDIX hydrolase [Parafrankia colletiae]